MEAVARRAGTSRAAIYRRWSRRPALVRDAIATHLVVPEQTDTGCTLCDVDASFQVFLAAERSIRPEILSALCADRDLLLDLAGSLVHYQAMLRPPHLSDHQAEHAIEILPRSAARDYPALVAHSEALEQDHLHS